VLSLPVLPLVNVRSLVALMRLVVVTQRLPVWTILPCATLAFLYLARFAAVGHILLFALGSVGIIVKCLAEDLRRNQGRETNRWHGWRTIAIRQPEGI